MIEQEERSITDEEVNQSLSKFSGIAAKQKVLRSKFQDWNESIFHDKIMISEDQKDLYQCLMSELLFETQELTKENQNADEILDEEPIPEKDDEDSDHTEYTNSQNQSQDNSKIYQK